MGAGHRLRIQPACCVLLLLFSTKRVANGDLSISFMKRGTCERESHSNF